MSAQPSPDTDPLDLVLDAVEALRENERHCPGPEAARRVCRALWLAQQLDPVLVALRGSMKQRQRAAELLTWVVADAQAVADPDLAEVLSYLIIDPTDPGALLARAHPDVLAPLAAAEASC